MNTVTLEAYNDILGSINEIMESCTDAEKKCMLEAVASINMAKLEAISVKTESAEELFDNDDITSEEYREYRDYLESERVDAAAIATPYMVEAALSISNALANSEIRAYESTKGKGVMATKPNAEINHREISFIHSRLKHYAKAKNIPCPSKIHLKKMEDGVYEGFFKNDSVMTVTTKGKTPKFSSMDSRFNKPIYIGYVAAALGIMSPQALSVMKSAKAEFEKLQVSSERAIKEYVDEVLVETGDVTLIKENLETAISEGVTSHFAAQFVTKIADAEEIRMFSEEMKI